MKYGDKPALVGIVPRKELWPIIRKERWYHVPVASAPRTIESIRYLAFYFPAAFGEEFQYRVFYYAPVRGMDAVKRIELFPDEPRHPRAKKDYYRIGLGQIKKLPRPIPSRRFRRLVHIPSTYGKLMTAREINDLYETSPLEDTMYRALKREKIDPERQLYVEAGRKKYCLDFCVYCKDRNIDIECDGESYHTLPKALARDRARNNDLASRGWSVLRFSGSQIRESLPECLSLVKKTVRTNKGLAR
ncbi:MAG TPA: DUF559 domain-containing protein [bacterium]|nr:DUF559 domain-containing protein [bacterium]